MRIERLSSDHDRGPFDCGVEALNDYIKKYASQNDKNNSSRTYVAVQPNNKLVVGFYSLTVGQFEFAHLPPEAAKKLARYPISVCHIGRLATDLKSQGQGVGRFLLMDALSRASRLSDEVGIVAVDVIAKENSKDFYLKYGFEELLDNPSHLYMMMKKIKAAGL